MSPNGETRPIAAQLLVTIFIGAFVASFLGRYLVRHHWGTLPSRAAVVAAVVFVISLAIAAAFRRARALLLPISWAVIAGLVTAVVEWIDRS
jgi:hypothetical protein